MERREQEQRTASYRDQIRILHPGDDAQPPEESDLHICPECHSPLVQPTEWGPVDMLRWRVVLRCPDCSWEHAGVFHQHVLDRFDALLDDAAASLQEDLARLEHSNMEGEISRFTAALSLGYILPEDF